MVIQKKLSGGQKKRNKIILLILSFIFIHFNAYSQVSIVDAFPNLEFTTPVDIQHAGDSTNRLFVVEQEGLIHVFQNTPEVTEFKVFLDIRNRVKHGGEMGLLGLAFHPEYETNGYFYVNYTTGEPEDRTIISRFQVTSNPDSADPESELRILRQEQPFPNHNGGQIVFGPDSNLYIAFGDGGGIGNPNNSAQRLNTILGKIIRINVDSTEGDYLFAIPHDNPFKGNPMGYREEIYAYGLRNPWRFSFDTLTNRIWCADVGQGDWEEINIISPGGNYGWRFKEGKHCYNPSDNCDTIQGLIDPVWEYKHGIQGGSITGGHVYRGPGVPQLTGKYIYADFMLNKIWALTLDSLEIATNELLGDAPGAITSFGVDENQELYFCAFTLDGNKLYKFNWLTRAKDDNDIPGKDFHLYPAYPNPFNPVTQIKYNLPEESLIKIEVFSMTGERITSLIDDIETAGERQITWNASGLSSGMYLIRLEAVSIKNKRTYNNNIKVILLK